MNSTLVMHGLLVSRLRMNANAFLTACHAADLHWLREHGQIMCGRPEIGAASILALAQRARW